MEELHEKGFVVYISTNICVIFRGCEKSWDYRFYETEIVFGEEICYTAGSDIELYPIIYMGYTNEQEYDDGHEEDDRDIYWYFSDLEYTLSVLNGDAFTEIENEVVDTEIDDETYNYVGNNMYDYYELEDMLDLGELEVGTYQYELTLTARYSNYQSAKDNRFSLGMVESITTEMVEFEVKDYCGEITTEVVQLEEFSREAFLAMIEGFDADGNTLDSSDFVLFEDVLDTYIGSEYLEYSLEDTFPDTTQTPTTWC
jgi:hypothetical protein